MLELKRRSPIVRLVYILSICVCSARLENEFQNQSFVDEPTVTQFAIAYGQVNGPIKVNNNQFGELDRPNNQKSPENETGNRSNSDQPDQAEVPTTTDELGTADSLNDYAYSEKVMLNKQPLLGTRKNLTHSNEYELPPSP